MFGVLLKSSLPPTGGSLTLRLASRANWLVFLDKFCLRRDRVPCSGPELKRRVNDVATLRLTVASLFLGTGTVIWKISCKFSSPC